MGKNLIPVIAKELGVEIGEEFEMDRIEGKFRFSQQQLQTEYQKENFLQWMSASDVVCQLLLAGNIEIVKLPFKPVYGQRYYTFTDDWDTTWVDCEDTFFDFMCKELNVAYRSEEDAYKARPAKYKELTGKDWEE